MVRFVLDLHLFFNNASIYKILYINHENSIL